MTWAAAAVQSAGESVNHRRPCRYAGNGHEAQHILPQGERSWTVREGNYERL